MTANVYEQYFSASLVANGVPRHGAEEFLPTNRNHFPMQNREKIVPKTSSVVISPVMLPR
jgi:hypothetical protein